MCAKILKKNGQIIPLSTYRTLNDDEVKDPGHQAERAEFDKAIKKKLGESPSVTDATFDGDARTPEHELYSDDFEGRGNMFQRLTT